MKVTKFEQIFIIPPVPKVISHFVGKFYSLFGLFDYDENGVLVGGVSTFAFISTSREGKHGIAFTIDKVVNNSWHVYSHQTRQDFTSFRRKIPQFLTYLYLNLKNLMASGPIILH